MHSRLLPAMLCMVTPIIAGPIALTTVQDASSKAQYTAQGPSSKANNAADQTLEIKIDIATLKEYIPLPAEFDSFGDGPLELRISLGPPEERDAVARPKQQKSRIAPRAPWSAQVQHSAVAVLGVDPDDGIDATTPTAYKTYTGDGTPADGWPTQDQWISYASMKALNYDLIMNSCSTNGWGVADNTPDETDTLFSTIDQVAATTLLDHRFILACVLQESKGCVRVPTTYSADGVRNPGLLQDHDGQSTCNSGTWGTVLSPCPQEQIEGMITEGVAGASAAGGMSLVSMVNQGATGTVADFYRAARWYNSGPLAPVENLDNGGGATASYASDIANRLTGWVG